MEDLSPSTLMLALKSMQREQSRLEALIQSEKLSEEQEHYYGQYILDLMKALSEVGAVYELGRVKDQSLLPLAELMKTE